MTRFVVRMTRPHKEKEMGGAFSTDGANEN